jgi:hypothetical protein
LRRYFRFIDWLMMLPEELEPLVEALPDLASVKDLNEWLRGNAPAHRKAKAE